MHGKQAAMGPQIAAGLLLPVLVLWQPDQPGRAAPTDDEIDQAIERLGDDRFQVRERASAFLWQAGRAAEPALRKALTSDDPEVVCRAGRILRRFHYGIYPDTPEPVLNLIGRYRYGTEAAKLSVLKALLGGGETQTVSALLKTERDEHLRARLTGELVNDLDKLAGALFIEGQWARVEQLLKIGATADAGMRNYAAYLLVRGQLDAAISALKQDAAGKFNTVDAKLLAYLLRAKGDLAGARSAAQKASDPALTAGVLFELGDWAELARLHHNSPEQTTGTSRGGIVDLGYAAAYHRLAGNAQEFGQALEAIKRLAQRKPNKLWYCGETLIINGRFQDAVDLLQGQRPAAAFEILCCQLRFREALTLAGVDDPPVPHSPWLAQPATGAEITPVQRTQRFSMGVRVGAVLCRLNETQQAARLFSELAQAAKDDNHLDLRSVCEAEYKAGLTEQAFEHAALVLGRGWNTSVLGTLFPDHRDAAQIWWRFLCHKYPDQPRRRTATRLRRILQPAPPGDSTGEDWLGLVQEVEAASRQLSQADRAKWLTVLGEACRARGETRIARSCLEKAVQGAPSVSTWTRLADVLAEESRWERAAGWYHLAWQQDRAKPTALYLEGRALVQAGRRSQGRKLIEAARLLPLGNDQTRYDFARDLKQRGLTEEAVRQWQWTLRTGRFQSAPVTQAAEQLADLAAGTDDRKAAAYWQWPLLRCLRTTRSNFDIEGYLKRAHLIHKTRARALIASGRMEKALGQIRLSHAALPGQADLAIELVPPLEKAGYRREADELFAQVFAVHERVCAGFPNSAANHHELARLAAGCRRRPDEALKRANRAVRLGPSNPTYISTLAEIHFQRGHRQQALQLARRCVQLAPQEKHFHQQLQRFEAP